MRRSFIEFWHPAFAKKSVEPETRAAGRFSGVEVRNLLTENGHVDLRKMGCPEHLFVRHLERLAIQTHAKNAPVVLVDAGDRDWIRHENARRNQQIIDADYAREVALFNRPHTTPYGWESTR